MKKVFLICPVRSGNLFKAGERWVEMLEQEGVEVHWPHRDTDQTDDGTGLHICEQNRTAIEEADAVYVLYDKSSLGSHFDFGMAFALKKPIKLINWDDPTPTKSFFNVLRKLTNEAHS